MAKSIANNKLRSFNFSNSKFKPLAFGLAGMLAIFIVWQLAVSFTPIGRVIPYPLPVLQSFFIHIVRPIGRYNIVQHVLFSLSRVGVGWALSGIAGIALGIAMGYSETVHAIARPIFNIIRPIPGLAWIPIAILWFGIGEVSKYFVIFMGGFAHVVVNTMDGARRVDKTLIGAAKMLGASRRQEFFNVILPASVPYIFAGLQISLSGSWMAVLAAEMVSSREGSGWIIIMGLFNGDTVQVIVGIISIGLVGLGIGTLMRTFERRLDIWKTR